jgi:hypothetical protein
VNESLSPQYIGGRQASAPVYRAMVNAFADAVHSVRRDNLVVAGGLAPDTYINPKNQSYSVGPLAFMRSMLCMSKGAAPRSACSTRVKFDVWSVHPYSGGSPSRHAAFADDVWIADLPKVADLLRAAARAGHIESNGPLRFWVSEFGWNSMPPHPKAVPLGLEARWVPEALYQMWRSQVTLATWFKLRDDPRSVSPYQSGLYLNHNNSADWSTDTPKPALASFWFPFVAYAQGNGMLVWGRTPWGMRQTVLVERSTASGWQTVGVLSTNAFGIFTRTFPDRAKTGMVRARVVGADAITDEEMSPAFSLVPPKDLVVNAFGG